MKIILSHNRYQHRGGEDVAVEQEFDLLRQQGHEVHLYSVSNDRIRGLAGKLAVAWHAPYSPGAKRDFAAAIADFRPDIVHVHNFFPLLTPSIYDAAIDQGVPVVQTLHNYRLICAGALLMREGRVCEKCVGHSPYWGALHRCYRRSALQSLAVARMNAYHQRRGTWREKVDCFIAPSAILKEKLVSGGFPAERIVVKPNFVPEPDLPAGTPEERQGALYAGRLSHEKGMAVLLQAWQQPQEETLRIAGDGPMLADAQARRGPRVDLLGYLSQAELWREMRRAAFLIMPSICYEVLPLVPIQAFASGLPVIASRLGAMQSLVEDGVTGLLFEPGQAEDLNAKVAWARRHPEEMRAMGARAREIYSKTYSAPAVYAQQMAIYDALAGAHLDRPAETPSGRRLAL